MDCRSEYLVSCKQQLRPVAAESYVAAHHYSLFDRAAGFVQTNHFHAQENHETTCAGQGAGKGRAV